MDATTIAIIVAAVAVGVLAQTVAGFGFALIAVPVFVAVLDVRDAIVLATLLGCVNSAVLAYSNRRHVPWATVSPMIGAAVLAMPIGLAVLLIAPAGVIRLLVGVSTFVMALALLRGLRFGDRSLRSEVAVGALSGMLNTSTGINGPPVVLYLQGRELPPDDFRAALAVFFFSCNLATLFILAVSGLMTMDAVFLWAASLPAVGAGFILGGQIAQRVAPTAFRGIVFALLFASAFVAIASALSTIV